MSEFVLDFLGHSLPLAVKKSDRAKKMRLSIDKTQGRAVVTLPRRVSEKAGIEFARKNASWIFSKLSEIPDVRRFKEGFSFDLLGERIEIRLQPEGVRGTVQKDGVLYVSGGQEFLGRRVREYIHKKAKRYASEKAQGIGREIGRKPSKIRISDPKSRWGSCSSTGVLSFSWRLALAPVSVFDYVIIHEMMHFMEMNHSNRFWERVKDACPDYLAAQKYLKTKNAFLHSFR